MCLSKPGRRPFPAVSTTDVNMSQSLNTVVLNFTVTKPLVKTIAIMKPSGFLVYIYFMDFC